jgi:AcrR family transcriptional regulator
VVTENGALVAETSPGAEGRPRRTSDQVEQVVLAAARELFAAHGYERTTTREIAGRAGVHEPLLYRRWTSKAGLFRAAVLTPFNQVVTDYLETAAGQADELMDLRSLSQSFIDPLYALLREHGELVVALVQGRTFVADGDESFSWPNEMGRLLASMNPQLELEKERRGLNVDPRTTNIVVLGMVIGLALLEPVLPSIHTTPEQVSNAMLDLIMDGVQPVAAAPDESELLDRLIDAERRAARAELELELIRRGRNQKRS